MTKEIESAIWLESIRNHFERSAMDSVRERWVFHPKWGYYCQQKGGWVLGSQNPQEIPTHGCNVRDRLQRLGSFSGGSDSKESECNGGDPGSVPGSGGPPGKGHGYPLQYSSLENSMHKRSLVGYHPWGCKESDMPEWLTLSLSLKEYICMREEVAGDRYSITRAQYQENTVNTKETSNSLIL